MTSPDHDRRAFHAVLKSFQTMMLLTKTEDGPNRDLRGRPMHVAEVDEHDTVWLVTSEQTGKVAEIQHDPHVVLVGQTAMRQALVSGIATLQHDQARIDSLWSESWKVWFPKGKRDPSIVLIAVAMRHAEYWDTSGTNLLSYVWEATKAYVKGEKVEERNLREQHGVVDR